MTVAGTKTIEGYLLLALPADDDKAKAIGKFEVSNNDNSEAISQDFCDGVSIL